MNRTTITLVTGNPHKLAELQQLAPADLPLRHQAVELDEIQSLDLQAIVDHKVRQAYDVIGGPVIIEDVSAGLASLNGLPGPFIKFFEERLGRGAMYTLSKVAHDHITITCLAAYYDGARTIYGRGVLEGHVVEPRGEHGFGFDCCVVPDGTTATLAELTADQKNALGHRGKAFRELLRLISQS
jgi:inosine triphosphate pyrophosphatase